ncbi:MAG: Cap15 family cyclic dinucleotide receptor domain-containing protein [Methylobacter sp.]
MVLHDYAIIGHKRSEIGRWLGIASLLLAPIITHVIIWLSKIPFLVDSIQGNLTTFTLSTGIVYLFLYWSFNHYGWRLLDRILNIPDLNGRWVVRGVTKNQDGTNRFEWEGEMVISQKWDRIAIELKTKQSGSYSETASVLVKHDGESKLSYSYQNHPRSGEVELQKHQGFCELIFDVSRQKAEGHYFNSLGRYTFGYMILTKIEQ